MKPFRVRIYLLPAASIISSLALWQVTPVHGFAGPSTPAASAWDQTAAAKYLDDRAAWWQSWPKAQVDHGTVCISCHTTVPYMMARRALRASLHETSPAAPEDAIIASVETRVRRWLEMVPFYSDANNGPGKTAESHSTEAVMNAVLLLGYDESRGRVRQITRTALDNAWALQYPAGENAGGWLWQDFHLAPWESTESSYQGAAMLMLALASTPKTFTHTTEEAKHLRLLQSYLQKHYAAQPLLNQTYVYWASAKVPGLLTAMQRAALLDKIQPLQQSDGGWNLASLDNIERHDHSPQSTTSDGYATALVALALQANAASPEGKLLHSAIAWLEQHQQKDGRWQAYSLNKERDPESNIGKFMSDTATGFAVLALEPSAAKATPLAVTARPYRSIRIMCSSSIYSSSVRSARGSMPNGTNPKAR